VITPSSSVFSYNSVRSRNGSAVSYLRSLKTILDLKIMTPTPILLGNRVPPLKLKEAAKARAGSRFGGENPIVYEGVT
jgi:hypothetical protein